VSKANRHPDAAGELSAAAQRKILKWLSLTPSPPVLHTPHPYAPLAAVILKAQVSARSPLRKEELLLLP